MTMSDEFSANEPVRRSFLGQLLAMLLGGLATIVPIASGLAVYLDPLGRKAKGGQWVEVATLASIPPNGKPYVFPVITERRDAWSSYPPDPIGSVYLRRTRHDAPLEAFSSVCPHLGCSIDFSATAGEFFCPCHNSSFTIDGERVDGDHSPSPRDLDTLEVKLDGETVLVDYRRFQGGKSKKIEE